LKEEVLDRAMWRNCFGGDFEPVVRQNTMNEWMNDRNLQCKTSSSENGNGWNTW
jgi:hypothetical protein